MSQSRTSTLAKGIQDALVAHLAARPAFVGLPVLGRRKSNIVNDISAAVQKLGSCLYIFPALPVRINANNPGPYIDRLQVRVRVIEHPTLNRTGPDAYELVELVLRELDALQLTVDGAVLNPLFFESGPVEPADEGDLVIFDIVAFTSAGLEPRT